MNTAVKRHLLILLAIEAAECLAVLTGHERLGWILRLWDTASGALAGLQIQSIGFRGAWVAIDVNERKILGCSGKVWRWLAWTGLDAEGRITRNPAEIFGPLPQSAR